MKRTGRVLFSRAAGEVVPLLFGLVAGVWVWPFTGWPFALLGFFAGWAGLSQLLRRLRRHRRWRRAGRIALAAWVVVWSAVGLRESHLEPPGPVSAPETADWGRPMPFQAGVAEVLFALPARATLAGWGQFPRRLTFPAFAGLGVPGRLSLRLMGPAEPGAPPRVPMFRAPASHGQPMGARALVLAPGGGSSVPPLAFVRLDLIEGSMDLSAAVLDRVGDLGFTAATLIIAATHTHSGPGGFHRARLAQVAGTDHFDREVFEAIADAAATAVRRASAVAEPARIALVDSRDRGEDGRPILARNRRRGPDDVDDRVTGIRLESRAGGRVLALLVNHVVHPVFRRRDHFAFDRDLPGAIEDAVAGRLPDRPMVLFVNGAEGDVNFQPADDMEELAGRFADRIAGDLAAGKVQERLRIIAGRVTRDLGSPHAWAAAGRGGRFVEDVVASPIGRSMPAVAANLVALPFNAVVWSLGLSEVRLGFSFRGAAGLVLNLERWLPSRTFAFGAVTLESAPEAKAGERRLLLWCPVEPTTEVGRRWRRAAAALGHLDAAVFGLTNGAASYVTTAEDYVTGSYEGQTTLFGPGTEGLIEEALLAALDARMPVP